MGVLMKRQVHRGFAPRRQLARGACEKETYRAVGSGLHLAKLFDRNVAAHEMPGGDFAKFGLF